MEVLGLAPIIVTDKLQASKDFYCKHLHFEPVFEADWYVHLRSRSGVGAELALMIPDAPDQHRHLAPPFRGEGLALRFQVADVDAECERLWSAGVNLIVPLRDEPWGERHFSVLDPNGVYIDVVQMIEPAAEYAAAYADAP